jgi:soluble lytic murein transglycosylase-like protein
MDRAKVVWLALFAVLLVSDGGSGMREAAGASSHGASGSTSAALSEPQVSAYLGRLNPELSERQRGRIAAAVVKYSGKYRLDPALVLAVIREESSARPWVRSSKGAVGLMQVMPHVMGALPVAGNLTSVESNVEAGCMILADNIRRLGEARGILAYFWGNDIRGASYLENVQEARAAIRRQAAES